MIIEGFEIENWTCIKKLTVSGLPPTGVIVLHGPNRTGKSSLVQALRACLMDYSSTSTALKSYYPRGSGEKPTVSVTFTAGGTTFRIKKCFGSNKSELASRTSTGAWKVETNTAPEAHSKVCDYAGGDDSNKGLRQLLWLTQAEFRLPDPKKFDAGVQAQLRGILGVLQTPLDDRFIERVKKRWNTWYSGQRKVGKQHEIKDGCRLAEKLRKLDESQEELKEREGKFKEVEVLLRQTAELDLRKHELERQLGEQTAEMRKREEELQRSQTRIGARRFAEERNINAVNEQKAALEEQRLRAEAAQRCLEDYKAIEPAQRKVESVGQRVNGAGERLEQLRKNLGEERNQRRYLQKQMDRAATKLKALRLADKLVAAQKEFEKAVSITQEIAEIEQYLEDHPVPDEKMRDRLTTNRQQTLRLQADLEAASMDLILAPESGASAAQVAIDGGPLLDMPVSDVPILRAVRRKAEVIIGGWGRVELSRGTGSGDLDQIEVELRKCSEEFANAVNPLGVSSTDPNAWDLLLGRVADHRVRRPELAKKRKNLKECAPNGLEALRAKVVELQTQVADIPATDPGDRELLTGDQGDLEGLATTLTRQVDAKDEEINALENDQSEAETNLQAFRQEETAAKEELATWKAKADSSRAELDRLQIDEEIERRVRTANRAIEESKAQLKQTELTNEESTINERFGAANEAVRALERQIDEGNRKGNIIKGRLLESEGLHSRRSSLAARVDELTRLTESESLEKDAVDRLYELFEECREKQLGTLMGPIHDRVLNWMHLLGIGDYKEVRFSDAFLPDRLVRRDGTAEFNVEEESTGAQEQIGMLVRLALGSILTSTTEPAIAILDDPLTHCDIARLNKMRVILRRAADGDAKLTPPAGPLQILILTCHPEWFRDERATVIDLENADVMQRFPG